MAKHIAMIFIVIFISVSHTGNAAEDQISQAAELIKNGAYDGAIAILRKEVEQHPENADAYLHMARAYHRKKDLNRAYGFYRRAIVYRPAYKTEMLPLLSDMKSWEEIIDIAMPSINKGQRDPSLFGVLLTAFSETERKAQAEKIFQLLKRAEYQKQEEKDQRYYILAYWVLGAGDPASAKMYLKKIKTAEIRQQARTSPKFKKLHDDPEFVKILP